MKNRFTDIIGARVVELHREGESLYIVFERNGKRFRLIAVAQCFYDEDAGACIENLYLDVEPEKGGRSG